MISQEKLKKQFGIEQKEFDKKHKKSKAQFEQSKKYLYQGVPMNWMVKWPGGYPICVKEASGARFTDIDGNHYIDLCLGDTGAMVGHSPSVSINLIKKQLDKGITMMLPTEDTLWVGQELQKRFGLKYWQFALTATDANRFSIRLCRHATGRKKIIVMNYCYHGSVDESFATLDNKGKTIAREGNIGAPVHLSETTKVIEFNDLIALENALKEGDVACVLTEPAMTNIGIIHPDKGYHQALRALTEKYGTLLIIDETHTICCGVGGYTKAYHLKPDIVTLGKPIGSGIPAAVYGFNEKFKKMLENKIALSTCDTGGIGGTLAGNALSMAAIKATLQNVLTDSSFKKTIPLAERFAKGVKQIIDKYNLEWNVTQLGCRAEYWFKKTPAKNGYEAAHSHDFALDQYMHLATLNRGILMTPFHNMALIAPQTTTKDIDLHTKAFEEAIKKIVD